MFYLQVFLHHLNPLLTLPGFLPLWLTVLDLLRAYMHADNSENLYEAIPESLKNMLLVMASAGVLQPESYLWTPTWRAIDAFLPGLKNELFPDPPPLPPPSSPPQSQSPTSEIINQQQQQPLQQSAVISLVDQLEQQSTYPNPVSPIPEDQSCSSPLSQSPRSDTSASLLSTSPRLQEVQFQEQQQQHQNRQQPVTPVKIILPSLVLDNKEPQQVITLVNQPPPSVSSPVAVQPAAHLYGSVIQEPMSQQQQVYQVELNAQEQQRAAIYQSEYRQQTVSIRETSSPTKHQYTHMPQMQDFHVVSYTDTLKSAVNSSNPAEVKNAFVKFN